MFWGKQEENMYIQNFKHKTESSRQIQNPRFIIAEIL